LTAIHEPIVGSGTGRRKGLAHAPIRSPAMEGITWPTDGPEHSPTADADLSLSSRNLLQPFPNTQGDLSRFGRDAADRVGSELDRLVVGESRGVEHAGVRREARWLEVPNAALLLQSARTLVALTTQRDALPTPFAHALLATFLLTGARSSEVLGLEVSDVSFDRGTVTIRPNGWRRLKTLTSARVVPLWPQLEAILRPSIFSRPPTTLLFPSFVTGREAMLNDWRKTLDRIAVRARWTPGEVRSKAFRHTYCAARLQTLEGGAPVSPFTVSRELGHGSGAMVEEIYAHLGTVRHRSEVVEYRLEQHAGVLADRLAKLGFVTTIVRELSGRTAKSPATAKRRRGQTLRHRGAGIRTRDLLLPKQARYRTAPHPAIVRQQLRRFLTLRQAECSCFWARWDTETGGQAIPRRSSTSSAIAISALSGPEGVLVMTPVRGPPGVPEGWPRRFSLHRRGVLVSGEPDRLPEGPRDGSIQQESRSGAYLLRSTGEASVSYRQVIVAEAPVDVFMPAAGPRSAPAAHVLARPSRDTRPT
jgi:integrase